MYPPYQIPNLSQISQQLGQLYPNGLPTGTIPTPTNTAPTAGTAPGPGTTPATTSPTQAWAQEGGGWTQFATQPGTPQYALMQAFQQGLTGQAAVNYADFGNANYGSQDVPGNAPGNLYGISYNPSENAYGLPNGYYVALNPATGKYDLIQRGSGGGGTAGGGSGASQLPSLSQLMQQIGGSSWNSGSLGTEYNQLYSTLMNRANESLNVNPNDPTIRNQIDPAVAAMTRQGRNYLADLAERDGPNANLSMEGRMIAENTGQQAGQLEASVIGTEIAARRQEIQQALSESGSLLSNEQQLALRDELAKMDAALQLIGIGQNAYQFDQNNLYRNSPLAG